MKPKGSEGIKVVRRTQ